MTLWLVRHAQVLLAPGTCYGALDVAADREATQHSAASLAAVLPPYAQVRTSPLQRCEQLAQALHGLRPDLTLQTDARLQEMNFGAWEGRRWSDFTRSEFDAWTADFAGHAVGGHGESVRAVMARVAQVFDELPAGPDTVWITHAGIIRAAQLLACGVRGPDTVWITHAGIIRAAQLLACGVREVTRADQWPLESVACGQWRTLELSLTPPPQ